MDEFNDTSSGRVRKSGFSRLCHTISGRPLAPSTYRAGWLGATARAAVASATSNPITAFRGVLLRYPSEEPGAPGKSAQSAGQGTPGKPAL